MLKLLGEHFVYDGTSGEVYLAGRNLVNAIDKFHHLGWGVESESKQESEEASDLMGALVNKKIFTNQPIQGQCFPVENDISNASLGEMTLVVTDACNLRCSYCPHSACGESDSYRKHGKSIVSKNIADSAANYFIEHCHNGSILGFFGGEPLLNFSTIKAAIKKVTKAIQGRKDIAFTVTTNLFYISEEIIDFLAENNVLLLVSIDGPKNIHDRYRSHKNGSGTHKNVTNNLNLIKTRNKAYYSKYVSFNCLIATPFDLKEVDVYFSVEYPEISFVRFGLPNDSNPEFYTKLELASEEVESEFTEQVISRIWNIQSIGDLKYSRLLSSVAHQYTNDFNNIRATDTNGKRPFRLCLPGEKMMVNIDGSLSICDKCESLKIGTIKEGVDISYAGELVKQWQTIISTDCAKCWASALCKACYVTAWDGHSLNRKKLKRFCKSFRNRVERWSHLYLNP